MAESDTFHFSQLKVFEGITDQLPENAREIIDIHEDLLFAWDSKKNILRVFNWRSAQSKGGKDIKHQSLIPSSTQNFTVSKVLISHGGGFAAIFGTQGLSIIELPTRWGTDGLYHDGKAQITCKAVNIHESTSDNHLEVIQTRWHPNSPSDTHLLALYSDNSLRIYDEGNLKQIWRVGPVPGHGKLSFMKSLGDTAIDFDIAPAQLSSDQSPNNSTFLDNSRRHARTIEWPIVILRGNGTIFVLCAGFNTEKPRLQGPLTMSPSQKDNYGDDSCSLLILPSQPITIVIAENSGILHHALMIENNAGDCSFDETTTILQNDWDLHVLENVHLELGLQDDNLKDGTSPLYLKRDLVNEERYFCYHDAGLHGISLGFMHQLQKFIENETEEVFSANNPSRAEYILSTKAFSDSKVNAVVGFGIFQSPSGIIALMSSGQIVSLNTARALSFTAAFENLNTQSPNLEQKVIDQSQSKISFDQHIKMMLKSDGQLPILKLDKNNPPSAKQAFQLLMNSIQIMREKQFPKLDKVRQEIIKRVKILELMKNQQRDEILSLLDNKKVIQEKAYRLADMHEDIVERQLTLQKRINDLSRLASLKSPNSSSEKEFSEQIKKLKVVVDKLNQDVTQIKAKHEAQKKSSDKWSKNSDNAVGNPLPPKQEERIKEFVGDMMKQIQALKSDVQKVQNVTE